MRRITTLFCLLVCLAGCVTTQSRIHEDPILSEKLKAVMIPEMDFRDAAVRCPVAFCQAIYAERYSPAIPNWQDAPRDSVPGQRGQP